MMRFSTAIALGAVALLVASCLTCGLVERQMTRGSGRVVERAYDVSDFRAVKMAAMGDLTIQMGEREALRVEAERSLIDHLTVDVRDGTLHIGQRPGVWLRPTRPVRFYLTVRELDTILATGSGNVRAPDLIAERFSTTVSGSGDVRLGDLVADAVELRVSGSGSLDVQGIEACQQGIYISGSGDVRVDRIQAETLDVRISGSGNLDVRGGAVDAQNVALDGSGDYRARALDSVRADVRLRGSGHTTLRVEERLDVRISGSGDVRYVGRPVVEQSTPGSGNVSRLDG